MGKAEAGTPKAIANRMKSKGLQKLRWYCEVCQKQCRDENGFKCHTMSENHLRVMSIFSQNAKSFVDQYSQEFLSQFMTTLKLRFGTKRVHANVIYNEIVAEKGHTHMNSTQWTTLSEFIQWLGREGHCVVDQTEKGWFITYIDRDPAAVARQQAKEKDDRKQHDDEDRHLKAIQEQIRRAKEAGEEVVESQFTELQRAENEKIVLSLTAAKPNSAVVDEPSSTKPAVGRSVFEDLEQKAKEEKRRLNEKTGGEKRKLTALEEIMLENEQKKQKKAITRYENWLMEGIVVKVLNKNLEDGLYYKKKGVVVRVDDKDKFLADIEMLDSHDLLRLDQKYLETVIPAIKGTVLILNGEYRGTKAELESINVDKFCVSVRLLGGSDRGRVLPSIAYEDVSKLN